MTSISTVSWNNEPNYQPEYQEKASQRSFLCTGSMVDKTAKRGYDVRVSRQQTLGITGKKVCGSAFLVGFFKKLEKKKEKKMVESMRDVILRAYQSGAIGSSPVPTVGFRLPLAKLSEDKPVPRVVRRGTAVKYPACAYAREIDCTKDMTGAKCCRVVLSGECQPPPEVRKIFRDQKTWGNEILRLRQIQIASGAAKWGD